MSDPRIAAAGFGGIGHPGEPEVRRPGERNRHHRRDYEWSPGRIMIANGGITWRPTDSARGMLRAEHACAVPLNSPHALLPLPVLLLFWRAVWLNPFSKTLFLASTCSSVRR